MEARADGVPDIRTRVCSRGGRPARGGGGPSCPGGRRPYSGDRRSTDPRVSEWRRSGRAWLGGLRDQRAKARIVARIRAAGFGQVGDIKPVGGGVFEMRISMGPGYRVYYVRRGEMTYLLLVGGDKSTQSRDIRKAMAMAADLDGSV